MTWTQRDLHLEASPSQGSPVVLKSCAASARHLVLGDCELVALARADHELALAPVGDLAWNRFAEKCVPVHRHCGADPGAQACYLQRLRVVRI